MRAADHRAAYEDLLRRYVAPLRRLASSYVHDPAGRDDLFQEIAMALWTALPRFRGDSSERTWVYRVAHNTAISFAANRRRRDGRELAGDPEREPIAAAPQEGDAIDRQQRERLWAAVQELPVTERQMIALHLEGLSAAEIEAITGASAGAVATRLTRIRQKLAARLRDDSTQEDQIRLVRSVTYWYLLPLFLPVLWQAVRVWDKRPWAAAISLAIVGAAFAFVRWLNVTAGVGALLATRANVESMFPQE